VTDPVPAYPVGPPRPSAEAGRPSSGRIRLHPLTPLFRGFKFVAVAFAAVSWQGIFQAGVLSSLISLAGMLVLATGFAAISWLVTGYEVVGRELRVYEGLIFRRNRTIPLERVQAIDVVRPVFARIAGLAELRLEVVGGSKTEAPLAYLSVGDATRLRERLIALVTRTTESTEATAPPEQPVHAIVNRDLLIAQALTPQALFFPFGALGALTPYLLEQGWSTVTTVSLAATLIGIIQVPVRRLLDDWNFRIATDPTGLRLRHGLLNTRSQTVPPWRVQAVRITWPLLWRPLGWQRSRIDVAGYGAGESTIQAGVLLPVADEPTTRRVTGQVLSGAITGEVPHNGEFLDAFTLPLTQPPPRIRWLRPFAYRNLGFTLTDEVVASRDGWLTIELTVVPLSRIQSVRVTQGPLQRRLGVAHVYVDTAGGMHAVGEHRDAAEAAMFARVLAERSREARLRAAALQRATGATRAAAVPAVVAESAALSGPAAVVAEPAAFHGPVTPSEPAADHTPTYRSTPAGE
jgi:putative membrane protein